MDFALSEQQEQLAGAARRFARERVATVAAEADRVASIPAEVIRGAWELGLLHPTVPSSCGGLGLSELDSTLITEELAWACTGIQSSLTGNTLAATPIMLAGSEAQQRRYLGMLTSEPILAAFATSESGAGSDVAAMTCRCERHGSGWILRGEKAWVTNARSARWMVIFATEDPTLRHRGIGAFVVEAGARGLQVGPPEDKLGQRACETCSVSLEDVEVPNSQVLCEPGFGFKLAMETFDRRRPDIGASAVGLMRRALDECVAYAEQRHTFGVPIAQHQMVQAMIAEMAIRLEATQLLVRKAAWGLDRGVRSPLWSSCAKAFGADSAVATALDAVQIFGGNGYVRSYPVEKLLRDSKVLQIYEGTSQIQRWIIARHVLGPAAR